MINFLLKIWCHLNVWLILFQIILKSHTFQKCSRGITETKQGMFVLNLNVFLMVLPNTANIFKKFWHRLNVWKVYVMHYNNRYVMSTMLILRYWPKYIVKYKEITRNRNHLFVIISKVAVQCLKLLSNSILDIAKLSFFQKWT